MEKTGGKGKRSNYLNPITPMALPLYESPHSKRKRIILHSLLPIFEALGYGVHAEEIKEFSGEKRIDDHKLQKKI